MPTSAPAWITLVRRSVLPSRRLLATAGGPQPPGDALRIEAERPLADETLLPRVDELDWILDGDDVLLAVLVDEVDHRGERCRFAGPRRSGHQDEPFPLLAEGLEDGGHIERIQGQD